MTAFRHGTIYQDVFVRLHHSWSGLTKRQNKLSIEGALTVQITLLAISKRGHFLSLRDDSIQLPQLGKWVSETYMKMCGYIWVNTVGAVIVAE